MHRRIGNIVLFIGAFFGGVLLILGALEIGRGNRTGWLYVLGGVLAIVLGFVPGRRLRDKLKAPDA